MTRLSITLSLLLFALGSACIHVNEARVDLDETVGTIATDAYRIEVTDGLATIREHRNGEIELWAQAPEIELSLVVDPNAPNLWTVDLRNAMPTAQLIATDLDSGGSLLINPLDTFLPTHKRWAIERNRALRVGLQVSVPDAAQLEPLRFAVLNDVQEDVVRVQDIFSRLNEDPTLRFVVSNGDITDNGERDQFERFQRELEQLHIPFYSTIGNHELIAFEYENWPRLYGRANFSWAFKGTHFTFLDTASASLHPRIYTWLEAWLVEGEGAPHVVISHITPLDPSGLRHGAFRNRREGAKLLAMLAKHDVDLTLYGHIHSLYVFENAGIPAYITGGGGAIPEELDGIDRHVLIVEVDPSFSNDPIRGVTVVRIPD